MATTAKSWSSVVGSKKPPQHMTTTSSVYSEKELPEWGTPTVAPIKTTSWTPGGAVALAKKKLDEKKTDITSVSEFPSLISQKSITMKAKEHIWSLSHASKLAQIGTRCHDDGPISDTIDEDDY